MYRITCALCTRLTVKETVGRDKRGEFKDSILKKEMGITDNIKKIFFITIWCIVGIGALALLIAAINMKNSKTCKSYKIEINNSGTQLFIDQKQILDVLTANGTEKIAGRTLMSFDLHKMEEKLKKNAWIKDAQLFFGSNEILRVNITERQPIARIFTSTGNTFYIDSNCVELPLPAKSSLRLPVFTSFPYEKVKLRGTDSALCDQVRKLSWFILNDPFWMADIEQINIKPDKTFEMVPIIGNHLIEFGDGTDYQNKFHRLFVFYKQVSAKTGFDKYSRIDVAYTGQVIGTRRGSNISRSDSLLALKNILELIKSARQLQSDTVGRNTKPLEHNTVTEQSLTNYDLISDDDDSVPGKNKKPIKK